MKTKVKFNIFYEIGMLMTCLVLVTEHFGHSLPKWLDNTLVIVSLALTVYGMFRLGKDCRKAREEEKK